jgi:hypothetical protein
MVGVTDIVGLTLGVLLVVTDIVGVGVGVNWGIGKYWTPPIISPKITI